MWAPSGVVVSASFRLGFIKLYPWRQAPAAVLPLAGAARFFRFFFQFGKIGQLQTARSKESGGTTNRVHEQLGYGYDTAGNLHFRSNNALTQTFWSLSRDYWQAYESFQVFVPPLR